MRGTGNESHESGGAQTHAQRFETDYDSELGELHGGNFGVMSHRCQPGKTEDSDHLHHAEQPQRAVDADFYHPQPTEQTADDGRPQPGIFGDQSDLSLAESHIHIERCGKRGAHAIAQFVEKQKGEDQQRAVPAPTRDEFMERLDYRFTQGFGRGGAVRFLHQQRHRHAGQHEQGGDDEHQIPRQKIGQNQRQRTRHQTGNAIGIHMYRIAQPQLAICQQLAAVGIQHDVLRGAEKGEQRGDPGDGAQITLRRECAH